LASCAICHNSIKTGRLLSLNRIDYLCDKCFGIKIEEVARIIKEGTLDEDFPLSGSADNFIKDLTEEIPITDSARHLGPSRNLLDLVRDRIMEIREREARRTADPGMEDLFPTRMELAEKYNSSLKKLLIEPTSGLPYIYINRESPGMGFLEVSIPTKLEWVFSMEEDAQKARLWVNEKNANGGIAFLQTISAICTGIQNLIDLRELARNPNFIISEQALQKSDREEGAVSKLRRLSLQSLAPIVCALDYRFYPADVFQHALSLSELMKIPAADRWRKYACQNANFIELIIIYAAMLDRYGEFEKAGFLLEKIFMNNTQDERVCFLMAKINAKLGNTEIAIENIERAISKNPERAVFHESRYNILEGLPLPDPVVSVACPDITGIYELVSGNMPSEDETMFRMHLEMCPACKRWLKIMEQIREIEASDTKVRLQEY
jgi:tetratricopeptide (TPR) repeat protein